MTNQETEQERTLRYLKRISFEEMLSLYYQRRLNKVHFVQYGWTEQEFTTFYIKHQTETKEHYEIAAKQLDKVIKSWKM